MLSELFTGIKMQFSKNYFRFVWKKKSKRIATENIQTGTGGIDNRRQ